jgi:hypothetical protein
VAASAISECASFISPLLAATTRYFALIDDESVTNDSRDSTAALDLLQELDNAYDYKGRLPSGGPEYRCGFVW